MAALPEYIVFSGVYPGCDSDASEYQYSDTVTSVSISDANVITVNNQIVYDYCDVGTDFFNDVLNNQTVTDEINYCVTNQQNGYISTMSIPANYAQILYNIYAIMSIKIVPLKFGSLIVVPNMVALEPNDGFLNLQIAMVDNVSESIIRKTFSITITRSGNVYSGNCDGTIEYICNIPIQ